MEEAEEGAVTQKFKSNKLLMRSLSLLRITLRTGRIQDLSFWCDPENLEVLPLELKLPVSVPFFFFLNCDSLKNKEE